MTSDEIVRALRLCADKSENFEECHSGQCDCPFGKTVIDCTERMNRAAADLIELLTDEIPHWISVSERLPVESEFRDKSTGELIPLLVCVEGTEFPFRALYDGKSWGDGWNKIDAKYWMPLPQPPKENEI